MATKIHQAKQPGREFDALRPPELGIPALNVPTDPWEIKAAEWQDKKNVKPSQSEEPTLTQSPINAKHEIPPIPTETAANIAVANIAAANSAAANNATANNAAAEIATDDTQANDPVEEVEIEEPAIKGKNKEETAKLLVKYHCKKRKEDPSSQRNFLQIDRFIFDVLVPALGDPTVAMLYIYLFRQTYGQTDNKTKSFKISHPKLALKIGISPRTCQTAINTLNDMGLVVSKGEARKILEHFVRLPWVKPGEKFPESAAKIATANSATANSADQLRQNLPQSAAKFADDHIDPFRENNQKDLSQAEIEFPFQFKLRWDEMKLSGIDGRSIRKERERFSILFKREGQKVWDHAWGVFEDMVVNGDIYGKDVADPFALLNSSKDYWNTFYSRYEKRLQVEGVATTRSPSRYDSMTEEEARADIRKMIEAQFGKTRDA